MTTHKITIVKTLAIILLALPLFAIGQSNPKGGITMTADHGSKNREIHDILTFEGIDSYNVQFTGREIKGRHFCIIVKTLWDGKITGVDTLVNTSEMRGTTPIKSNTLKFKVLAKKFTPDQLKVFFRFDQFGHERIFEATTSSDYSFRAIGTQLEIEIGKPFPAFAYILPYEKNGWQFYCAVDKSGKEVESWGSEFGIKHYLIFEMLFQ